MNSDISFTYYMDRIGESIFEWFVGGAVGRWVMEWNTGDSNRYVVTMSVVGTRDTVVYIE